MMQLGLRMLSPPNKLNMVTCLFHGNMQNDHYVEIYYAKIYSNHPLLLFGHYFGNNIVISGWYFRLLRFVGDLLLR